MFMNVQIFKLSIYLIIMPFLDTIVCYWKTKKCTNNNYTFLDYVTNYHYV